MKIKRVWSFILILFAFYNSFGQAIDKIDLSGHWNFVAMDANESDMKGTVILPGTLDENQKGIPNTNKEETTHLSRLRTYQGKACYSHEIFIPKQWKRKNVYLHLERTKPSTVFVDGRMVGANNNISTPQTYLLGMLKPGRHRLLVIVDNSAGVPQQLYASSHAYTEDTQTNWNGIIGQICLSLSPTLYTVSPITANPAFNDFHVKGQHFYANGHLTFLRGKNDACVWPKTAYCPMDKASWLWYFETCKEYGINHVRFHSWCPPEAAFQAADSLGIYLQPELPFWGNLDEQDSVLVHFLHKEGLNILNTYAHHPSFVMMALGNELWGSIALMKRFTDDFRKVAPHVLYTFGTNYFLGYEGVKDGMDYFTTCRVGGEAWGSYSTHTRASFSFADAYEGGTLNGTYPNSAGHFEEACRKAGIPVISHETGQFQSFPDFDEIGKYTGILQPFNMQVFKKRLHEAGMSHQAKDFHRSSYEWSKRLYKADVEMTLRTRNMAGFQLLDLQDYPGQGSAYVGMLDAFMEPKADANIKSYWRQFCNDVVPLFISDRFTFAAQDTLKLQFQIANYSGTAMHQALQWELGVQTGEPSRRYDIRSKQAVAPVGEGLADVPCLTEQIPVADIITQLKKHTSPDKKAWQLCLRVRVGQHYANSYDLWIYDNTVSKPADVLVVRKLTKEVASKLDNGAKVLWMPDSAEVQGRVVGGLFQTDYWNYRMFKTICDGKNVTPSPGTLGILTNPKHPIFVHFPTEEHTNWQWYPVIKAGTPLILDAFPKTYQPLVQVIDNVERNHKLGLVCQFKVGKGSLLMVMSDLEKAAAYPEGKAFYDSVLAYMQSAHFAPTFAVSVSELKSLIANKPLERQMKELHNISNY